MEDNTDFKEYVTILLKRKGPKNFKIKNSWGSKYIYRSVNKKNPLKLVDECTFLHIIRTIHNYLAEDLSNGIPVYLPHLGDIYLVERECHTRVKNGRIITTKPINWKATQELWYKDKEAERDKIVVRDNVDSKIRIVWSPAKFINCTYFWFKPCRALAAKLKNNIKTKDLFYYGK